MNYINRRQVWEEVWSASMEPTIPKGGNLVVDRYYYATNPLGRWDIVIIVVNHEQISFFPKRTAVEIPDFSNGARKVEMIPNFCFVTRILGLPGEDISLSNGVVTVNDNLEQMPKDLQVTYQGLEIPPKKIPDLSVFFVNDNWRVGVDSRHTGPIPMEFIVGKVVR